MKEKLKALRAQILNCHVQLISLFQTEFPGLELPELATEDSLSTVRELFQKISDFWLSRKNGVITLKLKELGKLPAEERPQRGAQLNAFRGQIETHLSEVEAAVKAFEVGEMLRRERIDVTLPGLAMPLGRLHPISRIRQKIEDIFVAMGYSVEDGPEIDTTFYNFDALNIPAHHPARESQDTFYVTPEMALRSQTSNVQIHAMQRRTPPLRVIAPGRVFRRDTPDDTHNPMFFQVEGLNVGPGITMGDLKGTLQVFLEKLFERPVTLRFRPSYFPFVEPGAETDFQCIFCGGSGCRVCKHSGWIELGGSGMVHPNVLKACGIDPTTYSGFAFGFGIDRMTAMLYGIDNIRNYFINDLRFLQQFN
ncbi:MAG: phenylalanine--tRNA ligase subunit alpha [Blastocatellia bacterium]|nr:phenylalanine--tRNA ligase subunit alpha [Blastocatellia bacterium]